MLQAKIRLFFCFPDFDQYGGYRRTRPQVRVKEKQNKKWKKKYKRLGQMDYILS